MLANVANAAAGFRPLVEVYSRHSPQYTLLADARTSKTDVKTTDALAGDVCEVAVVPFRPKPSEEAVHTEVKNCTKVQMFSSDMRSLGTCMTSTLPVKTNIA